MFGILYAFFWVIPRRLNFICRRYGKLCLFHLHRQVGMEMEQSVSKRRHIKFRRKYTTFRKRRKLEIKYFRNVFCVVRIYSHSYATCLETHSFTAAPSLPWHTHLALYLYGRPAQHSAAGSTPQRTVTEVAQTLYSCVAY